MSTSKRHHYLSQFYLKGFLDGERNWVYDRVTKELRKDVPKNIAVITNYYTTIDEKGERSTEGESLLSEIEGIAVKSISSLDKGEDITFSEKQSLSLFLAFFRTRVPQFERIFAEIFDSQAKSILQVASATEERVNKLVKDCKLEFEGFNAKDFTEYVNSDKYEVVPKHDLIIAYMFQMAVDTAKYLFQMDWFIIHTTDDKPIITTDVPFIIMAPKDLEPPYPYGIGLIQTGAVKLLPLTKTTALAMVDHGERQEHREFADQQISKFNEIMALSSERLVIGSDKELLGTIIEQTKLNNMEPNKYVKNVSFGDPAQGFITTTSLNVSAYNASWLGNLID